MKQIICFGDSNTYGYIPGTGKRYPWGIRWTSILNEKLGFEKLYETSPNYWYIKDNQILNRISCQKHKLKRILDNFDENLSESENMKRNFYKKVYDCGNIKWILKND